MTEVIELVLPYLVGPASGLVVTVCLLVALVWMGWRMANNVIGPLAKQWLNDQNKRFDSLMDEHSKDRDAFSLGINTLAEKLVRVDSKVEDIEREITDIKLIVRDCSKR